MLALLPRTLWSRVAHAPIVRDRRGITAMTFAVMALVLLGFVALSTEVGGWILVKTTAQGAADAAGVAAVLALNAGGDSGAALAAAQDAVTRNGFSGGAVAISAGPSQVIDPITGLALWQVTTQVSLQVTPLIAGLFTGATSLSVNAQAQAGMQRQLTGGTACVLATSGDLTITAAQVQTNNPCSYVSNAVDTTAIDVEADVSQVYAFVTAGQCSGCTTPDSFYTTRPLSSFQPAVGDPYQSTLVALAASLPSSTDVTCLGDPSTTNNTMIPATGNSTKPWTLAAPHYYAYCADVTITGTTTLTPGVYFFIDARLIVNGGTLQCKTDIPGAPNNNLDCEVATPSPTGVTLVFTGGNAGDLMPTVQINAGSNVNLGPPAASDISSSLPPGFGVFSRYGVLFWRDGAMPNTASGTAADIKNGSATSYGLSGLLYFPNAAVSFGGVAPAPVCSILVAATISLANQPSQFSDCLGVNSITVTPQVLSAKILE